MPNRKGKILNSRTENILMNQPLTTDMFLYLYVYRAVLILMVVLI